MSAKYPIRNTVRIILLNNKNELLLMCIDDPRTKPIGGEYKGRFWVMAGGQIENDERVEEATIRELLEETGINKNEVELGPVVWEREIDLILYGQPVHIKEKYIVAKTNKKNISLTNPTQYETGIIKELKWFSLDQITNIKETIYPVGLTDHLPDIIAAKYPSRPIKVNNC